MDCRLRILRACRLFVALCLGWCTLTSSARAAADSFVYAPLLGADAIAVWRSTSSGAQLQFVGEVRHLLGTRAARELVLHPSGEHAYVVHNADEGHPAGVSLQRVDRRTGRLEYRTVLEESPGPLHLAINDAGTRAYLADESRALVRTFDIDAAQGTWRERHTPMTTGLGPCQVLTDPLDRFLFILNRESCSVSRYRLDERGRPELAGEDILLNGSVPSEACIAPDGARFFVSLDTWDLVLSMAIDPRDGSLRTINAAATGAGPRGLDFSAPRHRLYVAERDGRSISAFDVDERTGRLGPRLGPFPTDVRPDSVAVNQDSSTLWVSGGGRGVQSFQLTGRSAATGPSLRPSGGSTASSALASTGRIVGLGGTVGLRRELCQVTLEPGGMLALHAPRSVALQRSPATGSPATGSPATGPTATGPTTTGPDGGTSGAPHGASARPGGDGPRTHRRLLGDGVVDIVVDPLGTWVSGIAYKPGRLCLVAVAPDGSLGVASPPLQIAQELASVAPAPCGRRLAVASSTPPALHIVDVDRRSGALRLVYSLPMPAVPDSLAWSPAGDALCVSHRTANRLSLVMVDQAGFLERAGTIDVAGGPGPVAFAPSADALYVGLVGLESALPCTVDLPRRALTAQTALAIELGARPLELEFRAGDLRVWTAGSNGGEALAVLRRHQASGALRLIEQVDLVRAGAPLGSAAARPVAASVVDEDARAGEAKAAQGAAAEQRLRRARGPGVLELHLPPVSPSTASRSAASAAEGPGPSPRVAPGAKRTAALTPRS